MLTIEQAERAGRKHNAMAKIRARLEDMLGEIARLERLAGRAVSWKVAERAQDRAEDLKAEHAALLRELEDIDTTPPSAWPSNQELGR